MEDINPAGCAMLNRPLSDLKGKRFQLFLPPRDRRIFTDFCKTVLDKRKRHTCETRLLEDWADDDHPEREGHPAKAVLIEGRPVEKGDGPAEHLRAVVMDISLRKQAEERLELQDKELRASRQALQDMNAKILHVRDEERRSIARELHDDCCQQLALSIITTNAIQQISPKPVSEKLHRLSTQLKRVLDTVRHVAYGLHPAMWENTGIEETARKYFEDFTAVTQLPVSFDAVDVPAYLPQTITTCLFRTLQEALHNVVKYAQASAVMVRLERAGDRIVLTVSDNGKGFNAHTAPSPRGMGLISLQERVRLQNGTFEIQSQPDKGATLRISLPHAY